MAAEAILLSFVEELYFRAQVARSSEERAALKGVQHCLERALAAHGVKVEFKRDGNDRSTRTSTGGYRNPL